MEPSSEHEAEKIERLRRAMYSRTLSPGIKDKPRHELGTERPVVGEEFKRPDPGVAKTIVAPRTIGLARAALWWLLGGAIVFFVVAIGFFAYYFLFGAGSGDASSSNISISVSGPPQISGGSPTQLQISVANRNKVPLELADLVVTYPKGTRSPSDFSTDLPSQRISLGTIESGGIRQGTISAVFAGNAGETSAVKVDLEYHMPGSNAIFIATTNYSIVFGSSPISIAIDGNDETISGQPVEVIVTIASNATAPVTDVLLSATYPFGFKFASATPAPSASGFWELGDLTPGMKQTITIRGTLSGAQGDQRIFQFNAGTRDSATAKKITTTLANSNFPLTISQPFLGLSIAVNGTSGNGVVVSPSETVAVSINWQNNLSTAIQNAVIVAKLTGIPIDGTSVRSSNGFYRSSDGVMLWNKSTDPQLSNLAPGSHGVASFTFQVPASDTLKSIVNPRLDISINAAGDRVSETGVPQNLQAALSQRVAIASDLQISAAGLYYTNPFGSTGPMPPKAGTETTYALVLTVTNTTNKITKAAVTAQLPAYARWIGIRSPSSEKVYFDGKLYDGGKVSSPPAGDPCQGVMGVCWSLGDVEPGVGLSGTSPRQAAIAIGVTPSTSQIGQQPALLQQISLTGTDASTGADVSRAAKDVTTNITQDPGFSSANATVVK